MATVEEGKLPEGWKWVRLGEVCDLIKSNINPQDYPDEIFAHYSIPAFDDGQQPVFESGIKILSNKMFFPNGTVLFSKLNPRISRVWNVTDDHKYRRICSTEFLPLIPKKDYIISEYLTFILQESSLINSLRLKVAAATKSRERLKPELVLNAIIPLPPLSEQKRIAAILKEQMAAVEKAKAAAKAQLEAIKALPAAYLREVFPKDKERKLPEAWKWVRLGEVCSEERVTINPDSEEAKRLPYLSLEHVESNTGKILRQPFETIQDEGKSNTFYFTSEHVLYGKLRPYLNKVAIPEYEGRCTTELIPFKPKREMDREFLALLLRRPETVDIAMRGKTGSRMPRANINDILSIEIPLPPLPEQKRIVAILKEKIEEAEKLRKSLEEQLETINKLPAALLRRAFRGEL